MRGRKPKRLTILSADVPELERIAHSDTSPWYQVRRARIVLGIAAGQRREDLAAQLDCDDSTIWRTCQRYRALGFAGLLADHRQGHSGRDLGITPVQRAQIVELAVRARRITW
jgi:transposase